MYSSLRFILFFIIVICLSARALAEGSRELAPNGNITINRIDTVDVCALYINNPDFGSFASKDNTNSNSRLYIHILDPQTECIYLGFSPGFNISGDPDEIPYKFHVKDPIGNIIYTHGTVSVFTENLNSWSQANIGPAQTGGAGGYNAIEISNLDLMSTGWSGSGDYYIEFWDVDVGRQSFIIPYWDITVANCSGTFPEERRGRLWSYNWALFAPHDLGIFERTFNGNFFIASPDPTDETYAFISRMDFQDSGFRPAAFSVSLNKHGVSNTNNPTIDRMSVEGRNATFPEYPVYLNDPVEIYQTAEFGSFEYLGIGGCLPDDYCIRLRSNKAAQIQILIDLDGQDGVYTQDTRDVLIIYQIDVADVNQEVCVPWNGIDGLGDQMAYGSASIAPIIISYEQGVYHFPIYDAEYLLYGFVIHAERPAGPNPKIFYDDRNITTGSGVGLPKIQLAGCDAPCHSWSTFITAETPGFGNLNTINTWWIIDQLTQSENIPLYYSYEKQFDIQLCPGELVIVGSDTLVADSVHTLQYTTFDGCDSILIYDIKEDEPEAAIVGRDLITCEYPLIELDGSSSNTGDQGNYLWFTNNGNIISPSNQAIIEINGAGDYILEASIESTWTGSTCTNYDTIVVDIDTTAPIIRIDHPGALKCNYKVLPIGAELIGDNLSYSWNTSDGNLLSSQTDIPALIDQAGVYSLVAVNDSNKCITIRDVIIPRDTSSYIQLNGPGVLDLEFCTSQPVQIQMIPSDAVFDSIRWNQSDGLSCDDCLDPIVSTLFSNNYLLAVTDTNGCRAYHPLEVRVDANLKIFVPNAFSPNNDGVNDVFKIYSSPCTVDILSFQVFDRWGAKMFEAYNYVSDEDVGWDGIMEGKTMDPAVFSWYLLAIGADGKETLLEGDVNLLR